MSAALKIPLHRFQPGLPVNGDVYLFLERNGKRVKIVQAGECFEPTMLERFRARGCVTLLLEPTQAGDFNPDSYPVHVAPVTTTLGQESTAAAEVAIPPDAPFSGDARIQHGSAATESEKSFSAESGQEQATRVAGGERERGEQASFSSDKAQEEEASQFSNSPSSPEAVQRFSADGKPEAEMKDVQAKFAADLEQAMRLGREEPEKETRFSQDSESEDDAVIRLKAGRATPDEMKLALTNKLAALDSEAFNETNPAVAELRKQQHAQKIKNALANLEEGLPISDDSFDLLAESEGAGDERIEELADEPTEGDAVLNAEGAPEGDAPGPRDEAAKSLINDLNKRTNAPRDMRAAVSNLAAQLAYSLGYTNPSYLSDLATTALLYFAQLDGNAVEDKTRLPQLAKAFFDGETVESTACSDAKQIIFFLEKYLSSPDCDRTSKDISPQVFAKIQDSLLASRDLNPWFLTRWQQFAEKGPSMNTVSLCSQASTRALKQARALI